MPMTPEQILEWVTGALQVAHCAPHELERDEELEQMREDIEDVRLAEAGKHDMIVELPDGKSYRLTLTISEEAELTEEQKKEEIRKRFKYQASYIGEENAMDMLEDENRLTREELRAILETK